MSSDTFPLPLLLLCWRHTCGQCWVHLHVSGQRRHVGAADGRRLTELACHSIIG